MKVREAFLKHAFGVKPPTKPLPQHIDSRETQYVRDVVTEMKKTGIERLKSIPMETRAAENDMDYSLIYLNDQLESYTKYWQLRGTKGNDYTSEQYMKDFRKRLNAYLGSYNALLIAEKRSPQMQKGVLENRQENTFRKEVLRSLQNAQAGLPRTSTRRRSEEQLVLEAEKETGEMRRKVDAYREKHKGDPKLDDLVETLYDRRMRKVRLDAENAAAS